MTPDLDSPGSHATSPPPAPAGGASAARPLPDFHDTREAFRHLSDAELRHTAWLFALMGKLWLTRNLSRVASWAVRCRVPGAIWAVRNTIYRQFVGGTSLDDARGRIERLWERGVNSILDYGAEAKSEEADFARFVDEVNKASEFGSRTPSAGAVVVKVTGIAPNEVLEAWNERDFDLQGEVPAAIAPITERLDSICRHAAERGVRVYIDAEESWFQGTIDRLADEMMRRHNRERVVVLNTFQLYRHDRLEFLRASHERAQRLGYRLGTKLVRGAYMDKERERARERGYPSPIQPDIAATHRDFDAAVRFCLERHEQIACTIGSHNEASTTQAVAYVNEHGIPRDHPHVRFAQLLGMSDNLTFNLAAAGFNTSKYVVYGPVHEVLPYLVRRAQENTSVTGELGRELRLLTEERRRRRANR